MTSRYISDTTRDINYAHVDTLRQLVFNHPITFNIYDELSINKDATRDQIIDLCRTLFNSQRSSAMIHNKSIGYSWMDIDVEKHGDKKEILIEAFGPENYKRMLNYFNTRAVVCRKWHGRWKEEHLWEWHRLHHPDEEEEPHVNKEILMSKPKDYEWITAYKDGVISKENAVKLKFHYHFGITVGIKDEVTGDIKQVQIYADQFIEPVTDNIRYQKMKDLEALEKKTNQKVIIERNDPT